MDDNRLDNKEQKKEYLKKYRESEKYKEKRRAYYNSCIDTRKKQKEDKLISYGERLKLLLEKEVIARPTYDIIKKALDTTKEYPGKINTTKINLLMSLYDYY